MPSIGSWRWKCDHCSKLLSTIHRKPCIGVTQMTNAKQSPPLLTHFTVIDRAGNRHVYDAAAGWEYTSQLPHLDRIDVRKKDSYEFHTFLAPAAVIWAATEPTVTRYDSEAQTRLANFLYGHTRDAAASFGKSDKWDSQYAYAGEILAVLQKGQA